MEATLTKAIFSLIGVILAPSVAYIWTKRREHIARLREEKLYYYKDFVSCLSGVIANESSPQEQKDFSKSCNNLNLVAPLSVINAVQHFLNQIKTSNANICIEKHDEALTQLLFEIRKDLGIKPEEHSKDFRFRIWSSGQQSSSRT